jgi:hypothetical protein
MQQQCASCGRDYVARRSNSRFCGDTCKKRAQRAGGAPAERSDDGPKDDGPLVLITSETLADAGVLETVAGAQSVLLARRMESGHETGAAMAAMSKQLQALVDAAMASVKRADRMDEVAQRRDEKLRRARGA